MKQRDALLGIGIAVLAAVAIVGWARKTETAPAAAGTSSYTAPLQDLNTQPAAAQPREYQPATAQAPVYQPYGNTVSSPSQYVGMPSQDYPDNGYIGSMPRPVRVYSQPEARDDSQYRNDFQDGRANSGYRDYDRPRRERSERRSAEIVAGSAAGGAAIGALAGGGKGAAIGALSGGAAGFIYDRGTRHH